MDSGASVRFTYADGTALLVEDEYLRSIYDELRTLSGIPGAISTAGLLLNEARKQPLDRHAVDLGRAQSTALRRAVDHCTDPRYSPE